MLVSMAITRENQGKSLDVELDLHGLANARPFIWCSVLPTLDCASVVATNFPGQAAELVKTAQERADLERQTQAMQAAVDGAESNLRSLKAILAQASDTNSSFARILRYWMPHHGT